MQSSMHLTREVCTFLKNSTIFPENEKIVNLDIDNLAKILQAINYRISKVDNVSTESSTAPDSTGIKITIDCQKSGERIILYNPDCECTCKPHMNNESTWEVTATSNSLPRLIETGSKKYPPFAPDKASLVKSFVSYMSNESKDASNTGLRMPRGTRLSLDSNMSYGARTFGQQMRYHSLDTLVSKDMESTLPSPGVLQKTNFPSQDSIISVDSVASDKPIPTQPLKEDRHELTEVSKDFYDYLKIAKDNLENAMAMMKPAKPLRTNLTKPTVPVRATKSPVGSFVKTPEMAGPVVPKPRINRPVVLPNVGSSQIRPPTKKVSGLENPVGGVTKKLNKYAHIKSTIPKSR